MPTVTNQMREHELSFHFTSIFHGYHTPTSKGDCIARTDIAINEPSINCKRDRPIVLSSLWFRQLNIDGEFLRMSVTHCASPRMTHAALFTFKEAACRCRARKFATLADLSMLNLSLHERAIIEVHIRLTKSSSRLSGHGDLPNISA